MTTTNLPAHRRQAAFRPAKGLLFSCALLLCTVPSLAQAALLTNQAATTEQAMLQPIVLPVLSAASDPAPQAAADVNLVIEHQDTLAKPAGKHGRVQSLLQRALAMLGTPYRWGGTSTDGFDCSGLVKYVFRTALGIELPRVSRDMAREGEQIAREQLTEGDLVFFSRSGRRVDHVGIYVGDGQFVHAPRTGKDVMVSRMDTGYWSGKFMQARRMAI